MNIAVRPGVNYYALYLLRMISTHPFVRNPIVINPITKEPVLITKYRLLRSGLYTGGGLSCSIYPHGESTSTPTSLAVTALYSPYNLGNETDKAIHHFEISFSINSVNYDGNSALEDEATTQVPLNAALSPDDYLFDEGEYTNIDVEINSGLFVIGDYLDLTRLILLDLSHKDLTLEEGHTIGNFEVLHMNLNPTEWEKQSKVYFHTGYLLVRFESYVSKTWRQNFIKTLINPQLKLDIIPPNC